jgi:hypothetical protein
VRVQKVTVSESENAAGSCGAEIRCICGDAIVGSLGVCATVNGEVRAGDVRRFGASHESYQRGDFFDGSVAGERCIGYLRRSPVARGRI